MWDFLWAALKFWFSNRAAISSYWAKHGADIKSAINDAKPLIAEATGAGVPGDKAVAEAAAKVILEKLPEGVLSDEESRWAKPAAGK